MNKVFLKGNCGRDPEITNFENGGKVAQFSLATTERGYQTRDGRDVPEKTDWHNIVVKKSGLAGVCEQYVSKGSPLLIVGKIQTRDYTDNSGMTRYVTEIVVEEMELLGQKRESAPAPAPEYAPAQGGGYNPPYGGFGGGYAPMSDDGDLPMGM